ncbi:MAG: type II secretion system protein [Bdellovibrionaceae bacterium]|nr:type II secretion system protein [Pseudobdellovibrionaceae bacterium]
MRFLTKKTSIRNGFSLLEILVALGLVTLILGVVGSTTFSFFKGLARVSAEIDGKDFIVVLTKYIQSQQGCQNSLLNLPVPSATEQNLTIKGFEGYGNTTADIRAGFQVSPRLSIENMTIKNKGFPAAISIKNGVRFHRTIAQIKITMRTSVASGSIPLRDYIIEVPVLQKASPLSGQIDACSVEMSIEDACVMAGGTFTPPTTCAPAVACEFKGTAYGCWPHTACPNTNYPSTTRHTFSAAAEVTTPPSSMCPSGGVPTSSGNVSYSFLAAPCDKYGVCTNYPNQAYFYICLKCN